MTYPRYVRHRHFERLRYSDDFKDFLTRSAAGEGVSEEDIFNIYMKSQGLKFNQISQGEIISGNSLVSVPIPTSSRWNPEFSTTTLDVNNRVTNVTDLDGISNGSNSLGTGPEALVDGQGTPFWRFNGAQFLELQETLTATADANAVFVVCRCHRTSTSGALFSLGTNAGAGNQTYTLATETISGASPLYRSIGRYPRNNNLTNSEWIVPGAQMHVAGAVCRGSADGGTTLWVNERSMSNGQSQTTISYTGGEIGRDSANAGRYGNFDVYDVLFYDSVLTDEEALSITAALQSGYGISNITSQLILEGDSIMQGTDEVDSMFNAAMVLTEPGTNYIPDNYRVVNIALSGNTVSSMQVRADEPDGSSLDAVLPGENVLAFEIGRNDMNDGSVTAQEHYDNVVAYLISPNGPLASGFDVRSMVNISSSASITGISGYRALLEDPAYFTDTFTNIGGIYEGQLSLVRTDLIENGTDGTVFFDSTDASNTTYYDIDSTHPNILGAEVRATGGSTPQYGIAYGLT